MTRLLRSPFPVAPKAPALLQHHLFGGPPEPVDADEVSAVSTPAMRRWCEIGGPEIEEAKRTQGAVSTDRLLTAAQAAPTSVRADRHGSRPGQLSRPGHSSGQRCSLAPMDRELALLDRALRTRAPKSQLDPKTPEAPSCGRAPGHKAAPGMSSKDRSRRSSPRQRPIIIRRRVQAQRAATVTSDVRRMDTRMMEAVGGASTGALPMSSPTQAQPEWSCATTWLRTAEASGEGSMQQVTAAASYMFVAAMLAFTFVI